MEQAIEHLGASKKLERSREGCAKMDGGVKKRKSAVNPKHFIELRSSTNGKQ